jgi:hypothetical protein
MISVKCSSYCEDSVGRFQWKVLVSMLFRAIPGENKNLCPLEVFCEDFISRSIYCGCNGNTITCFCDYRRGLD